ncbi:MAG: Rid family hydrolase [Hyphomicrobiaceae bacterium]|nr:Rid family hydrolase [Hyphomicrobiaceae bacterium]
MRLINPADFPKPASNYSQGVAHQAGAQRLVLSGQVGVKPDGTTIEGVDGQMKQAFANFLAVLREAGFATTDVTKVTVYVVKPALMEFRRARESALGSHAPAATYVQVAGLADPAYLVEIEGEAVKE